MNKLCPLILATAVGCAPSGAATRDNDTPPEAPEAAEPNTNAQAAVTDDSPTSQPSEAPGDDAAAEPVDAAAIASAAAATNAFGSDMFRLAAEAADAGQNVTLSPVSLHGALSMTLAGANGDTADEMATVLRFSDISHAAVGALASELTEGEDVAVSIASRIFVEGTWEQRIRPDYSALLTADYDASAGLVDFVGDPEAARGEINGWVSERTAEKIPELIPFGAINGLTRAVLANAIHFDGDWRVPFDANATADRPFHGVEGAEDIPTMRREAQMDYASGRGWEAVRLPYQGGEWDMLVVLPEAGDTSFGGDVAAGFDRAADGLESQRVRLSLPKFTIRWSDSVASALQALGMDQAFGRAADFSAMADLSGTDGLYVSDVFHEAFVQVDEQGTEAAAATAVVMATRGAAMPRQVIEMQVDRPFYFAIRHAETETLLFVGYVADPTAED